MLKALIDGDIVVYRAAASAADDDLWIAQARASKIIEDIIEATGATDLEVFLTGQGNFRRDIAPSYKANRPDSRPTHWLAVREFLTQHFGATVCNGFEADDQLGIEQSTCPFPTIICSIDKDLLQIPGRHYNFVKKEFQDVTHDQGLKALYTQSLVGDRSDNIIGVEGIGPVKAARFLDQLLPEEYYQACRTLYNDDERYHLNMKLLYIWRKPNDMWVPPTATADNEVGGNNREAEHPQGVAPTHGAISEGATNA